MLSHRFLVFDLAGPFQRWGSSQKISHNTLFFFQIPFREPCFQFQVFFSRKRCVHLYAPSVSFLEKFHFTTCCSVQDRHHRPSSLIVFCCPEDKHSSHQRWVSSGLLFFTSLNGTVGMVCEMLLTDRCHLKALCHLPCARCHDCGVCQLEVTLCHLCHSLWPRGYCDAVAEWFLSSVEDMRFAMMES